MPNDPYTSSPTYLHLTNDPEAHYGKLTENTYIKLSPSEKAILLEMALSEDRPLLHQIRHLLRTHPKFKAWQRQMHGQDALEEDKEGQSQ